MISEDEHYKRVCSAIEFFGQRIERTFNLFIQISIVTIGGFVWLKMQPNAEKIPQIFSVARWVIPTLAVVAISQIISDSHSWFGFRQAEATLLNRDDLMPKFPKAGRLEIIHTIAIVIFAIGGFIYLR